MFSGTTGNNSPVKDFPFLNIHKSSALKRVWLKKYKWKNALLTKVLPGVDVASFVSQPSTNAFVRGGIMKKFWQDIATFSRCWAPHQSNSDI